MPGPARDNRYLHLVRLDGEKLCGWQVRLPLWHPLSPEGVQYSEMFSDSLFGGREGARKAAAARRDVLFAEAGLPLRLAGHTRNTRNTSGVIGLSLTFNGSREGLAAFAWSAYWQAETGRTEKARFGVAKYGFLKALALAVARREEETGLATTPAQLAIAKSLWAEVEAYVETGERPARTAAPRAKRVRLTPELQRAVRGEAAPRKEKDRQEAAPMNY